ncbi:MAG: hypothetical protein KC501_09505 [Myxococcales bacterium]|nr:hypothetical protein [Myxococcales bacterium]
MRPPAALLLLAVACQPAAPSIPPGSGETTTPSPSEPSAASEVTTTATETAAPSTATTTATETAAPSTATTTATETTTDRDATASGPSPTWEWAVSVVPALGEHSQLSPSPEAYARFSRWFAQGPRTFYIRVHDRCHRVRGSVDEGFSFRETVTTAGNTRTRTAYGLMIAPSGITETGPGGTTYQRDEQGRWQEVGGFGMGCAQTIVHESISREEDGVAYFDAYHYTLTAECSHRIHEEQRCQDGSTRTCTRCAGVHLQPHASNRGWGRAAYGVGQPVPPPLHDCTQPCPVDEWTPRLEPLAQVLEGRVFHGEGTTGEGVLFRRSKDCQHAATRERARWAALPR